MHVTSWRVCFHLQSQRGFLIGVGSLLTTAFVKDGRSFIHGRASPCWRRLSSLKRGKVDIAGNGQIDAIDPERTSVRLKHLYGLKRRLSANGDQAATCSSRAASSLGCVMYGRCELAILCDCHPVASLAAPA